MKKIQSIFLPAVFAGIATVFTTGIASAQNEYVTDNADNPVSEITPSGTVTQFLSNSPDLAGPTGLAFNSAGDLLVANNNGNIAEFTSGGTFIGNYATGVSSFGNGLRGLAFDSAGNLFVANRTGGVITEIPMGGGPSITIGLNTNGAVNGVAFDSAGNLYVAVGSTLDKITFSSVGVYSGMTSIVTDLTNPNGVASEGGNVFVVNTNSNDVLEFDATGNLIGTVVSGLPNNAGHGLSIDSLGNFWVTDEGIYNDVTEYSSTGTLLQTVTSSNFAGPNFITTVTSNVPEPSAIALMLAGVGLLFYFTRRKLTSNS